ncbi:hypothetical protein Tco_1371094 [Tanacetum coccineum]
MNEDYYHEQNSCYDPNSFGFDQFQPPQYTVNHPIFNAQNSLLNAQNELLNSQNKLMEQMTSICDMVGQYIQKKEEDKRIAEEQAAKDRYWKILICYDDDEDDTIAVTPVLLTEEPVDSLIMEDEHLDTIPATESDEVIKFSVENLVPIPSEFEGIPDSVCDVHLCNNPTPLEAFKEHSKIVVDFNDDSTSSDDGSPYGEDIDYVDASPPDAEIISSEVVEMLRSFLLIRLILFSSSSPLRGCFMIIHLLALWKSLILPSLSSISPQFPWRLVISLMEEISLFFASNESIPSGIDSDYSDSEGDNSFLERLLHDDPTPLLDIPSPTHVTFLFEDHHDLDFTCAVRVFLPFFTYLVDSSFLLSSGSEDTIFDPGISTFHFFFSKTVAYENPIGFFIFFLFLPSKDKGFRDGFFFRSEDPVLVFNLQSSVFESFIDSGILNPDILDHFVEIPSGESKVHIEVLSVLWGNRLLDHGRLAY